MSKKYQSQHRNQHSGASGLTQREGNQLHSMWHKLEKLQKKNNLYVGFRRKILEVQSLIYQVLEDAERL